MADRSQSESALVQFSERLTNSAAFGTLFREGMDLREVPPDGYRADLTSVSGKTMRVYFFDYDTFAWGMSCPDNNCVQDSRFIMLDRSREPLPRRPPI